MSYYIVAAVSIILFISFLKFKSVDTKNEIIEEAPSDDINKETVSDDTYVLGTRIQLRAIGAKSKEAIDNAIIRLFQIDDRMSAFKENSDISKINKNAGSSPSKINEDTYFVIKKAVEYAHLSEGAFEPTIRPLVKLYGFGSKNPRIPKEEELKEALRLVNYNDIILDDEEKSVMLRNKNQSLDFGK